MKINIENSQRGKNKSKEKKYINLFFFFYRMQEMRKAEESIVSLKKSTGLVSKRKKKKTRVFFPGIKREDVCVTKVSTCS